MNFSISSISNFLIFSFIKKRKLMQNRQNILCGSLYLKVFGNKIFPGMRDFQKKNSDREIIKFALFHE